MPPRKKPITIDVPPDDSKNQAYEITEDGMFQEGDIQITATGLLVKESATAPPQRRTGSFSGESPWVDDEIRVSDLIFIEELGQGSGGKVHKVLYRPTNTKMALKIIPLIVSNGVRQQILLELKTLYSAQCPNIVNFYGAYFAENRIHIALELMDAGSLLSLLQLVGPFPEHVLQAIGKQVLTGLNYLHKERHLIHRDIKPSNILLSTRGEVKISDFGVSGQLATSIASCKSWVGTVTYMSPERIQGHKYTAKSDIWSFGVAMLELAIGRFPYHTDTTVKTAGELERNLGFWDLLDLIVQEDIPKLGDEFSPELCQFCEMCMAKEPSQRPSSAELLEHMFIVTGPRDSQGTLAEWVQQFVQPERDVYWSPNVSPVPESSTPSPRNSPRHSPRHYHSETPPPMVSSPLARDAETVQSSAASAVAVPEQRPRSVSNVDKKATLTQRVKRMFFPKSQPSS